MWERDRVGTACAATTASRLQAAQPLDHQAQGADEQEGCHEGRQEPVQAEQDEVHGQAEQGVHPPQDQPLASREAAPSHASDIPHWSSNEWAIEDSNL